MNRKPNILLLFADDMRFDTIAALGNTDILTPNIDKLVENGTSFTHAHISGGTCGAICMPSRGMLHTGIDLFHLEDSGSSIPDNHKLMGEYLGENGYDTYGVGKWHNGPKAFNRSFQDGNEIMFGGMRDHWNVPVNSYDPTGLYDREQPYISDPFSTNKEMSVIVDHITPGKHSTDLFVDDALKYLERDKKGKPFFLYLSFMAPHDPRSMPHKYRDMYDPKSIPLPENFMHEHPYDLDHKDIRDEKLAPFPREEEDTKHQIAEYYAMITHLDDRVGEILAKLKATGEYENTIILFAGDNGLAVGRHGLFGKQNMYDHSVRVPFIICGPDIDTNRKTDALIYLTDIFPTLCDHLNMQIPESVESESFKNVLDGKSNIHRDHIYTSYIDTQRAVRKSNWKLIRNNIKGQITHQLFDLESDQFEMANLFSSPLHIKKREELMNLLIDCGNSSGEKESLWAGYWRD